MSRLIFIYAEEEKAKKDAGKIAEYFEFNSDSLIFFKRQHSARYATWFNLKLSINQPLKRNMSAKRPNFSKGYTGSFRTSKTNKH